MNWPSELLGTRHVDHALRVLQECEECAAPGHTAAIGRTVLLSLKHLFFRDDPDLPLADTADLRKTVEILNLELLGQRSSSDHDEFRYSTAHT
jgi:hypothetical protein